MRALLAMLVAAVVMTGGAVACMPPGGQSPPATPVIVNPTSGGDSGLTVLLTVVVIIAMAAVGVAVWLATRRGPRPPVVSDAALEQIAAAVARRLGPPATPVVMTVEQYRALQSGSERRER